MEKKYCTECGTELDPQTRFCTNCGEPVADGPEQSPDIKNSLENQAENRDETLASNSEQASGDVQDASRWEKIGPSDAGKADPVFSSGNGSEYGLPYSNGNAYSGTYQDSSYSAGRSDTSKYRLEREIQNSKYAPITTGGYIGIFFLMLIPVVNLILLIVWACGGCKKVNKRNFARAALILCLIFFVIISLVLVTLTFAVGGWLAGMGYTGPGAFWRYIQDVVSSIHYDVNYHYYRY